MTTVRNACRHALSLAAVTLLGAMPLLTADAQKPDYFMFGNRDGVEFGWRSWHELADQIVSELKFVNNNGYRVQVRFEPVFTCPDGTEHAPGGMMFTIRPGEAEAGSWDGLFWYPCSEGRRMPTHVMLRNLRIERVD
jgi:hypothetical protein